MLQSRVEQLLDKSSEVLQDCALDNGAIVAANAALPSYPPTAESYNFVWGRDAAYQLYSAAQLNVAGSADIREHYLNWLETRAQGFAQTGVLIKRYSPNGAYDLRYGSEYQPDQSGALLWAVDETTDDNDPLAERVMAKLATGLCDTWAGSHFGQPTQDLWENRTTLPEEKNVFVYSLASVINGLDRAIKRLGDRPDFPVEQWSTTLGQMNSTLSSEWRTFYTRRLTPGPRPFKKTDVDASLSGLVFPFDNESLSSDTAYKERVEQTITVIKDYLYEPPHGVKRYEGDTYDGIVRLSGRENRAGHWPLLSFWLSIAEHRLGREEVAHNIYNETIARLDEAYATGAVPENLIPEQLFADKDQQEKAVMPLAWSHAMFVIATRELGIV